MLHSILFFLVAGFLQVQTVIALDQAMSASINDEAQVDYKYLPATRSPKSPGVVSKPTRYPTHSPKNRVKQTRYPTRSPRRHGRGGGGGGGNGGGGYYPHFPPVTYPPYSRRPTSSPSPLRPTTSPTTPTFPGGLSRSPSTSPSTRPSTSSPSFQPSSASPSWQPTKSPTCNNDLLDLVYVFDQSNSIGPINFDFIKQFIIDYTNTLHLGPTETRATFVTFGTRVISFILFNDTASENGTLFDQAVRDLTFVPMQTTNVQAAMNFTQVFEFTPEIQRPGSRNAVVFITDSMPTNRNGFATALAAQLGRGSVVSLLAEDQPKFILVNIGDNVGHFLDGLPITVVNATSHANLTQVLDQLFLC